MLHVNKKTEPSIKITKNERKQTIIYGKISDLFRHRVSFAHKTFTNCNS